MLACFFIAFYIFENRRNAATTDLMMQVPAVFSLLTFFFYQNKRESYDRFFFAYFPSLPQQNRAFGVPAIC